MSILATLGVVCVASGLLLSGVHRHTSDLIARREAAQIQQALNRIMPQADRFVTMEPAGAEERSEAPPPIWAGLNDRGQPVGWVVLTSSPGYGGAVRTLAGFTADGRIARVEVLTAPGETPGLGSRISEPAYLTQFSGLRAPVAFSADGAEGRGRVQAVTGATISSQAVLDGVNRAWKIVAGIREKR